GQEKLIRVLPVRSRFCCEYSLPYRLTLKCLFDGNAANVGRLHAMYLANRFPQFVNIVHTVASEHQRSKSLVYSAAMRGYSAKDLSCCLRVEPKIFDCFVLSRVRGNLISSPLSYAAKRSCNCSCVTPASRLSRTATSRNSLK